MKKTLKIFICCLLFIQLAIVTGCEIEVNHSIRFIVDNEKYYTIQTKGKEQISMPKDPIKNGYIFDGWYFDEGVWNEPLTINTFLNQELNEDTKVYAKFLQEDITKKEYTITYVTNGGTHSNQTKYTIEDSFTLTNATKEGYTFDGWYDGTTKVEKIETGSTGNKTLTAKWIPITYTITYENTKNATNNNVKTYTIESDTITLSDISVPGHTFKGWFLNNQKIETIETGSTGNMTLVAKWDANTLTITFDTNGGQMTGNKTFDVTYGTPVSKPADPTKEGYNFVGWMLNEQAYDFESQVKESITLVAKWEVVEYTITYATNGGTHSNQTKYTIEDSFTLTNATKEGYTFDGWYDGTTKVEKIEKGSTGNKTLTAKWTLFQLGEIKYNIDKKEVSINDEITPELFDAICLDSNGMKAELSVVVNGNQTPGNTIQVRIIAKSGNTQKQITLTDIKVYGMPELNIENENKDFINMTDTLDKDLFQVTATDTFGDALEIKVFIKNSYQAGDIVTIVIQAIDKAGNITEKRLENIKVYSKDDIKLNYVETNSIKKSSHGEEFKANAIDSFGEECKIEIRAAEGYKIEGGKTINLYIVAIDKAGNEKQSPLITNIKVYDIPTVNLVDEEKGYAITTNTNIDSLFIVTDSFGQELTATITADKELISGTFVNITVKAVDIVGNIFEKLYQFVVIDETKAYVELYIDDILFNQLFVDKENYTLPTTDNNGNDNLIWFDESNTIYTDSTGKGIETFDSSNKLYGQSITATIKGIKDLNEIRNDPSLIYVLTTDIDLGAVEWTPIDFSGILYGNNHIIKNFKITQTNSSNHYGLFGKNTGVIYNSGVEQFEISIESTNDSNDVYVGGLVGWNGGTINNSYATGNVTAIVSLYNYAYAGGLVGINYSGTINNSYATGNVTATSSKKDAYAGGLVGRNFDTISNSYATGDVTATSASSRYGAYAGGIVGNNLATINNSYCYSGQTIMSSTNNMNSEGVAKSMKEITSVSFYTSILCWDENIWDFTEGSFPKLKKKASGNQIITVKTIDDLESIRNNPTLTYILTTDIDLGGIEWTPINFSGIFYGNNHIIKNFKITKTNSSNNYGLFGKNNGVIHNLGVEDFEISVESSFAIYAGGLVGYNYGTISNSYATGNVTANASSTFFYAGGLVGYNYGTISNSYATGNVESSAYAGGLVGENLGTISNSYATGNVTATSSNGEAYAGGLVGWNYEGTISNSYATGNVTATSSSSDAYAGGLVGSNYDIINNSYATGTVAATSTSTSTSTSFNYDAYAGGLVGDNSGTISNSYATGNVASTSSNFKAYWGGLVGFNYKDPISNSYRYSGQIVKSNTNDMNTEGVAKSMEELTSVSFYTNTLGWDENIWDFTEGSFPKLKKKGNSNQIVAIKTIDDLKLIRNNPTFTYALITDIDLGGVEWTPIDFSGVFYGNNHIIKNFKITKTNARSCCGLFGVNNGVIYNLGVEDFEILVESTYNVYAGGLVGYNDEGIINNSYATGNVIATSSKNYVYAGGLVGENNGTISNSYATGNVIATVTTSQHSANAGGLVGSNDGIISNSYATGNITATAYSSALAGGLVGNNYEGTISNSYATGNVTAISTSTSSNYWAYAGGLVGDSWGIISNCYRYSGQIIKSNKNQITTSGVAKPMEEITRVSFYTDTLGWDENIWKFTEGSFPKLKK